MPLYKVKRMRDAYEIRYAIVEADTPWNAWDLLDDVSDSDPIWSAPEVATFDDCRIEVYSSDDQDEERLLFEEGG